jgi:peptide/nickel transport system substrate-binding protein
MKFRLAMTLVATSAALLAGCSTPSTPTPGGSASARMGSTDIPLLTGGDVGAASTIDPDQTQGCQDNYCGLFMEHLLQLGPNNALEPELATSMTQPNPVTYVYHLRHGVRFWDGSPMTSADVVYSLDYQNERSAYTSVYFTNVKAIEAAGPGTVVIKLKQPDAGWKYSLSYEGVIFEKRFAEAHKGTLGRPGVLIEATGPWEIKSYDPTRGMELSANPYWWGGRVPVRHITVKFFANETSEALAMRAGEISVAFPTVGNRFAATSGDPVTTWISPGLQFFAMDAKVGPWADIHVRRAVAYALDRTDIIAAFGGPTQAEPVWTIIAPSQLRTIGTQSEVSALLNSLPQYPYDLTKARQEMAQSRYPHGFTATTVIDNGTLTPSDPNVVQVIAAELSKIGITLKISEAPLSKYLTYYDTAGGPPGGDMFGTLGDVSPDPSTLPGYIVGSAATYNVAQYAPAWANSLLAEGLAASNPARRLAIYGQLLKRVGTDVPYVVLFDGFNFTALSSAYTLPPFHVFPPFFSWALGLRLAR